MKMKNLNLPIPGRKSLTGIAACVALASVAVAQQPPVKPPVALPEPVLPLPAKPETPSETLRAAEANAVEKQSAPATAPAAAPNSARAVKGGILLNFQGAALTDVLNYLSEAAGFVIVQEATVSGTVNVVSRQPITAEESVDLLNAVLIEKGYVAIRNGRILKIVNRKDAQRRDLPVATGSDPSQIPRKDEMVTQILPLRHGEAAKLVENLRPLLAETSTISANEGSNSILLTDTQSNIRRIAEIIQAIDTSVMSISTVKVYPLQFASATQLATVITQLYTANTASSSQRRGRGGFGGFGGLPGFGGGGGGGDRNNNESSGQSEARQAASRVVAVADDQSNSLIICAPDTVIPEIEDVIKQIDTSITDVTDTRIFRLQHADASEMAEIINSLYSDTGSQNDQNRGRNNQGRNGRGGFGNNGFGNNGFGGQVGQRGGTNASQQSERALLQSKVVAVGDPRTNSLLIIAGRDTMTEIAEMVGRLDATDARKQQVYVHSLEHADADSVANVLRGMLGEQTTTNAATQSGSGRLTERSANGATMDTSDFTNSNRGGGGGGR